MKTFLLRIAVLTAVCLSAAAFYSCSDDTTEIPDKPDPIDPVLVQKLSAEPTSLTFASAGEVKTIAVKAENVSWTATTEAKWLTLADASGAADGTISVTAAVNTDNRELTGTIVIAAEGVDPVTITVKQEADTTPRSLEANVKALWFTCGNYYTKTIVVDAENVAWDAVSDAAWLKVEKKVEDDSAGGTVTVTVERNTGAERSGTITLSAEKVDPVTITVTQKEVFTSELIGNYLPHVEDPENPIGKFIFSAEFKDPAKAPTVDLSFIGLGELPMTFILPLAEQIVGMLYAGGLGEFTFMDDGTVAAKYHTLNSFDMSNGPVFSTVLYEYPNAETLAVVPADAIGYYTADGKVYFTINKAFLGTAGQAAGLGDLRAIIQSLIDSYPELGTAIVSTDEYYAIPLKYELKANGVTKLYVDKAMMMPFVPLITSLVEALVPESIKVQVDPAKPDSMVTLKAKDLVKSVLDGLFNQTNSLEIGIELTKQAE